MSAWGQKPTSGEHNRKSALPPKADIRVAHCHVCFGPFSDSCTAANESLFDNLVGGDKQSFWDRDAERLGGLEIDEQFDFCGLLDWQVRRLLALKNAAGIVAGQTIVFCGTA